MERIPARQAARVVDNERRFAPAGVVTGPFLGELDCSVDINDTLTIDDAKGGVAEEPSCFVRLVGRGQ